MRAARFAKDTLFILGTKIGNLIVGVVFSILLARVLGPENKGIYSLTILFSSLFVTFLNFGLGPATVFFAAKGEYSRKTILENSYVAIMILGFGGVLLGILILSLTGEKIYPEIPRELLFLSLLLIPLTLFNNQLSTQYLLGVNKIGRFNLASFGSVLLPFSFFVIAVLLFGRNLTAVIWSRIIGLIVLAIVLLIWLGQSVGKLSLGFNKGYIRDAYRYGIKAYLGNVIGFLNYRVEVFLLGCFLPLSVVGQYTVAVGLAESLWLVSQSAGTLIFPLVSSEEDEERKKIITPLVARTVLAITFLAAVALFLLADWFIPLLYSNLYNPSIPLFKILLPGVVFVSASRVLANDIAGRGKPILNTYIGGVGLLIQLIVNLALIPLLGAAGAAWASSIAYLFLLLIRLAVYLRVTGIDIKSVVFPQKNDWEIYRSLVKKIWANLVNRITNLGK